MRSALAFLLCGLCGCIAAAGNVPAAVCEAYYGPLEVHTDAQAAAALRIPDCGAWRDQAAMRDKLRPPESEMPPGADMRSIFLRNSGMSEDRVPMYQPPTPSMSKCAASAAGAALRAHCN